MLDAGPLCAAETVTAGAGKGPEQVGTWACSLSGQCHPDLCDTEEVGGFRPCCSTGAGAPRRLRDHPRWPQVGRTLAEVLTQAACQPKG